MAQSSRPTRGQRPGTGGAQTHRDREWSTPAEVRPRKKQRRQVISSEPSEDEEDDMLYQYAQPLRSDDTERSEPEPQPRSRSRQPRTRNQTGTVHEDQEKALDGDRSAFGRLIRAMRAKKPTDREKQVLGSWTHNARHLARIIGPFINTLNILLCGIYYCSVDPEQWDLTLMKGMDTNTIECYVNYFERILTVLPELDEIFDKLVDCKPAVRHVSNFLERHMKQARSDDSTNVKSNILRFIAAKPEYPELRIDLEKTRRGFHHLVTARHICPAALLDLFDRSPQHFCDEALAGKVQITADHLPAFMYPDDSYNSLAPDEQLLQSSLIASCYRSVITGPGSALAPTTGDAQDSKLANARRSVAKSYSISECSPETIAYITTQCRFSLDATHEWKVADGEFKYQVFFDNILALFDDEEFAAETIKWYNIEVFGGGHRDESGRITAGPSTMELIAAKRRTRDKGKAPEQRSAQPAAQASDSTHPTRRTSEEPPSSGQGTQQLPTAPRRPPEGSVAGDEGMQGAGEPEEPEYSD
ncbi:uncharacterized protein C8Q71DRAFT_858627 [Rhodofomes roseus]|uniref:Uncharacterized protein n=1 Tax=Rhodofomes roseus TaxID=34475 RepID=A0ABQ8KDQ7_9APHY|nr:uncharacterized protein C8Q71DRAFT_858627 [Rhodofomes roseus]KAH9835782.1 hypothetical protein C8Q71DRAFT_858627 [Rhodofomes roseus]